MRTAAILISRQQIHPTAQSAWVQSAIHTVKWLSNNGYTIFTSEGLQTYELLIYLCILNKTNQTVVIGAHDMNHFLRKYLWLKGQFDFHLCNTVFLPLITQNKSEYFNNRDKYIVDNSDLLVPISIRSNGEMAKLIDYALKNGKTIDMRFEIPYQSRSEPLKYTLSKQDFSEKISRLKNEYLIHWTRTSSYYWPSERLQTYYQAITESDLFPRSAFLTLQNILNTGQIYSSGRHMPTGIRVVSFTGHTPLNFSSLMKWRSKHVEMSFEPYGIGIEKEAAIRSGIRPVFYVNKNQNFISIDRWLFQSIGKSGYWPDEDEYRYNGNVDFSIFSKSELICFCLKPEESEFIENKYHLKATSFLSE